MTSVPAIRDSEKISRMRKKIMAVQFSVLTALFLTIFKISIGLVTHSLGLFASSIDSLMDVLVSSVNLIAIKEADKPADKEHLYGHGKIESLAGLFQSIIISISGIYLVVESVKRFIYRIEIEHIPTAIVVMLISMILTFLLTLKLKRIFKETESLVVGTELLHFTIDFMTNGGIIAALILVRLTGSPLWDVGIAFIVACYILYQSFQILRKSIDELLDRALPLSEQKQIEQIILNHDPRIIGFHNLRTRKIGNRRFIDFHFEIRGEENFSRAHELTESLIKRIKEDFPEADITVHFDPEGGE